MKALCRLNFDCGRQGCLEGIFIADTEDVKYLKENKISVYFGEALGKHSEIYGYINEQEIEVITTEEKVIDIVQKYNLENGHNPFDCMLDEYETEGVPENGVDWGDCTVQDYIDFMRKGVVPEYYKKEYENWLKENKKKKEK